jgi:aspartate aminotransferase-like enzyme
MQLRIPGPTPCPDEVLQAMAKQMIGHRGKQYQDLMQRVTEKLKNVYQTKEDVLVLTAAGTGGLEAAVVNTLSPGEKVLSVSIGVFGDRWADIAEQYGADVKRLKVEWGKAADPDAVQKALKADPAITTVMITQNETSTGVTNDMKSLSAVVKEFDKLLLVDAISGLSSIDLPVDKWNCDVVVSGSQKGWMIPPGLTFVSVNQRAWDAVKKAKMPRFYFDVTKAKNFLNKWQTPWTPAVSLMFGLDAALDMILKEGLENVFARHAKVAKMAREGVKSLGLSLFADEACASNTVTAVKVPEGLDGKKINDTLRQDYGVFLSGGQKTLEGKIFRIGHLGWVHESDIKEVLAAIEGVLPKLGFHGAGG